jgi:hypothetical protein
VAHAMQVALKHHRNGGKTPKRGAKCRHNSYKALPALQLSRQCQSKISGSAEYIRGTPRNILCTACAMLPSREINHLGVPRLHRGAHAFTEVSLAYTPVFCRDIRPESVPCLKLRRGYCRFVRNAHLSSRSTPLQPAVFCRAPDNARRGAIVKIKSDRDGWTSRRP